MEKEDFQKQGRVPPYPVLNPQEKDELVKRILELVVRWEPIPRTLLEPMPVEFLRRLEFAIRKIREAGLAGGPEGAPLRLKILRAALELRGQDASPTAKGPSENQVLGQQPLSVQRQVRAQEGLNLRQSQSQEALLLEEALRRSS